MPINVEGKHEANDYHDNEDVDNMFGAFNPNLMDDIR